MTGVVREPKVAAIIFSVLSTALSTAGCSGMTTLMPTGPSLSLSPSQSVSAVPAPATPVTPTPAVSGPVPEVITGTVNPLAAGRPRCYLGLYSCEVYAFSLGADGGVDVTLTWDGSERDMLIQLYRADLGLVHEDLAPRGGAARITFRRPDLAAMNYEIRVVNLQREAAIPFTLKFTHWEN